MKLSNRLKVESEEKEISTVLIDNLKMYHDGSFSLNKWINSWNVSDESLERLFNLLCSIDEFHIIIEKYNADYHVIKNLFWLVMSSGGGQEVNGRYVPISMFLNEYTLQWILKNKNTVDPRDISFFLIDYFTNNSKRKWSTPFLKLGIAVKKIQM